MDSMQILSFSIAAGETKRFEVAGRYLEIIACPLSLNIEFTQPNGQQQGARWRDALAGFYAVGEFSGLEVTNTQATAQTVRLMITSGQGGYRGIPNIISANVDSAAVAQQGQFFIGQTQAAVGTYALFDSSTGEPFAVHELHFNVPGASAPMQAAVFTCTASSGIVEATIIPPPPIGFQAMVAGAADSARGRKRSFSTGTVTGQKDVDRVQSTGQHVIWRPPVPFIVSGTAGLGVFASAGALQVAAVIEHR